MRKPNEAQMIHCNKCGEDTVHKILPSGKSTHQTGNRGVDSYDGTAGHFTIAIARIHQCQKCNSEISTWEIPESEVRALVLELGPLKKFQESVEKARSDYERGER